MTIKSFTEDSLQLEQETSLPWMFPFIFTSFPVKERGLRTGPAQRMEWWHSPSTGYVRGLSYPAKTHKGRNCWLMEVWWSLAATSVVDLDTSGAPSHHLQCVLFFIVSLWWLKLIQTHLNLMLCFSSRSKSFHSQLCSEDVEQGLLLAPWAPHCLAFWAQEPLQNIHSLFHPPNLKAKMTVPPPIPEAASWGLKFTSVSSSISQITAQPDSWFPFVPPCLW